LPVYNEQQDMEIFETLNIEQPREDSGKSSLLSSHSVKIE